jgi:hypothetical protein
MTGIGRLGPVTHVLRGRNVADPLTAPSSTVMPTLSAPSLTPSPTDAADIKPDANVMPTQVGIHALPRHNQHLEQP